MCVLEGEDGCMCVCVCVCVCARLCVEEVAPEYEAGESESCDVNMRLILFMESTPQTEVYGSDAPDVCVFGCLRTAWLRIHYCAPSDCEYHRIV